MALLASMLLTIAAQVAPAMPVRRAVPIVPAETLIQPSDAGGQLAAARTGFAFIVDPAGRVSACRVTSSSGVSANDLAVCRILRARARFVPARDSQSITVADAFTGDVFWASTTPRLRFSPARAPGPILAFAAPSPGPVAIRAQPQRRLESLVTRADYPASALRAGEEGTVGFRLTVSPEGRVQNCVITSSSGSSALDAASCRLMRSRARFTPAVDDNGAPTVDLVEASIAWRPRRVPTSSPVT